MTVDPSLAAAVEGLAGQVDAAAQNPAGLVTRRIGTVTSVAWPTASVNINGTVMPNIPCVSSVYPVTGDSVVVLFSDTDPVIVGINQEVSASSWLTHLTSQDDASQNGAIGTITATYATYNFTCLRPSIVKVHASVVAVGTGTNAFCSLQITDPFSNGRSVNNEGTSNAAAPQTLVCDWEYFTGPGFGQIIIVRNHSGTAANFWRFYSDVWVHRVG